MKKGEIAETAAGQNAVEVVLNASPCFERVFTLVLTGERHKAVPVNVS